MNVSPGRFSDKTENEKKVCSIRWPLEVTGGVPATSPEWRSEPPGLIFENHLDPNGVPLMVGEYAYVRICGGARGGIYRVRHGVTVAGTGEYLEVTSNGEPGVQLQITGHGRQGSDYRSSRTLDY